MQTSSLKKLLQTIQIFINASLQSYQLSCHAETQAVARFDTETDLF